MGCERGGFCGGFFLKFSWFFGPPFAWLFTIKKMSGFGGKVCWGKREKHERDIGRQERE